MNNTHKITEETIIRHHALILPSAATFLFSVLYSLLAFPSETELHLHIRKTGLIMGDFEKINGISDILIISGRVVLFSIAAAVLIFLGYRYKKFYRIFFLIIIPIGTLLVLSELFLSGEIVISLIVFLIVNCSQIYYVIKMIDINEF